MLPTHGLATVNTDGTVTYLPQAKFYGSDSFSYTASDGRGGALSANVSITVRSVNDPPVILVAPSDQTNQIGDAVTLLVSVNDVDSVQEALNLVADGLPNGIELDAEL